jgi:5-methylcytosine-specific restriction endonuclease McrA
MIGSGERKGANMPQGDWGLNWKTWVRGNFTCVYCGFDGAAGLLAAHQFTVDHIRPQGRDGGDDQENLAVACCACNAIKASWDKEHYDPVKFAGRPVAEVLESARDFVRGWYRKWDTDYDQMIREVTDLRLLSGCAKQELHQI